MKRIFLFGLALLASVAVFAQTQSASISWMNTSHDFGTFKEEAGPQSVVFEFVNTGSEPLYLSNVKASCGCTATDYTKEPIKQGEKGYVKATYNPTNRPGQFHKSITVTSNTEPSTSILTIKGEVIAREKGVEDYYPREFGDLRLRSTHMALNKVLNTEIKEDTLGIVNMSDKPMTIKFQGVPSYIQVSCDPVTLAPKKANDKMGGKGVITIKYDAKAKNDWGFVQDRIAVALNDSTNSKYKITISATIEEDFSHLTPQELANAPVIVFDTTEYNFGSMKQGDKVTYQYNFTNKGKSDLVIRKVKATCGCTVPTPEKKVIKSGESSFIKATFNSSGKKGHQSKPITITCNDPKNSTVTLKIIGDVEDPQPQN